MLQALKRRRDLQNTILYLITRTDTGKRYRVREDTIFRTCSERTAIRHLKAWRKENCIVDGEEDDKDGGLLEDLPEDLKNMEV